MPTVFPYSLGLTQYRELWVAQLAELGGPYVVTFLLLLVSSALAALVEARREVRPWPAKTMASVTAAVALAALFGHLRSGGALT